MPPLGHGLPPTQAVSFAPGNTDQNPLVSNIADGDEITVEVDW
jgi:hypothetical protein